MPVGRNRISEILKELEENPSQLFDDSEVSCSENDRIRVRPGLSKEEKLDAMILDRYFGKGLILVTGPPGAGKDLFVKSTCWKMKRYFDRHVLLDDRPKSLFGPYIPFSDKLLKNEMRVSKLIASGKVKESVKDISFVQEYTEGFKEWMQGEGTSVMKGAVLGLTEYQPYMDKRRPAAKMNIIMGNINRLWRHMGITIFGIVQNEEDLDTFRCLPYVTTRVSCFWMGNYTTRANIYRCKFVQGKDVLQTSDPEPFPYEVNGKKSRENLPLVLDSKGNPVIDKYGRKVHKCYFDLFNSQNTLSIGGAKI